MLFTINKIFMLRQDRIVYVVVPTSRISFLSFRNQHTRTADESVDFLANAGMMFPPQLLAHCRKNIQNMEAKKFLQTSNRRWRNLFISMRNVNINFT